jgi:hypothetical protein
MLEQSLHGRVEPVAEIAHLDPHRGLRVADADADDAPLRRHVGDGFEGVVEQVADDRDELGVAQRRRQPRDVALGVDLEPDVALGGDRAHRGEQARERGMGDAGADLRAHDVVRRLELLQEAGRVLELAEGEQAAHGVDAVGVLVRLLLQRPHEALERSHLVALLGEQLRRLHRAGRMLGEEPQEVDLVSAPRPRQGSVDAQGADRGVRRVERHGEQRSVALGTRQIPPTGLPVILLGVREPDDLA